MMGFEKLLIYKEFNIFVQIVWFVSTILQKVLSFYVEICLLQQPPSLTCSLPHRLVFTCYSVLTRPALSAQSDIQQICHISLIVQTLKVQNISCSRSQFWNFPFHALRESKHVHENEKRCNPRTNITWKADLLQYKWRRRGGLFTWRVSWLFVERGKVECCTHW